LEVRVPETQHESAQYRDRPESVLLCYELIMYYSKEDLESIIKLVKENKFRKIYITGNTKTGKSHFCEKFTKRINGYKLIELDKERKSHPGKSRSEALSSVINENKDNSYILEHYQLLDENYLFDNKNPNTLNVWKKEADILVLLNPKRKNIKNGFDYDTSPIPKSNFDKLDGEIIYCNPATGTYVKRMNKNNESSK